jgi:predicted MPP superfamily phosphohydrolase
MVFPASPPDPLPDQNIQKRSFQNPEHMNFRVWVCSVLLISLFYGIASSASSLPEENTVTYSFIHISDPQSLTTNYPGTLDLTFSHIESLRNTYNISAIIITGDVVNTWNEKKEWDAYAHARNLTTIPIYEIAGNHDTDFPLYEIARDNHTVYGKNYQYYTRYTEEPETNYVTSVGDFDFVGINYAAKSLPPEELSRLRATLTNSSRSNAIIATHYYMDEGGNLSPLGQDIDTYLIVKPSLVLMGHMHANFIKKRIVGGYPAVADMTNYQDGVPGGTTGWDYSAGTLYTVTSVNGQVKTITARVVHIYPAPYFEEEMTVFGDGPDAPLLSGPGSAVTGLSSPVTPSSSCNTGGLSCNLNEFFQQCWTDFWHIFL